MSSVLDSAYFSLSRYQAFEASSRIAALINVIILIVFFSALFDKKSDAEDGNQMSRVFQAQAIFDQACGARLPQNFVEDLGEAIG